MGAQNWFEQLPQNLLIGFESGSLYALVALGYTLVYGVLQLINFAHSEVFMAGAFGSLLITQLFVGDRSLGGVAIPFVIISGALVGALVGATVAWILEKIAYRPLRKRSAPKLAFLISAIGASFFLQGLAGKLFNFQRNNAVPGTNRGDPTYFDLDHRVIDTAYFRLSVQNIVIIVTAVVMMIFLDRLVNKTKLGKGIRAVAEDAPTAALMGINIDKTISRTFMIGGALAGIAGSLFGLAFGASFNMGFSPGLKAFAAAVLGGIGNIRGAMLGGLLLGEVEVLVSNLDFIGVKWNDVISFSVLVLVLIFRPTGLLGERLGRAA